MNIRLSQLMVLLRRVAGSFWFIPAVMALVAALGAMAVLALDRSGATEVLDEWGPPFSVGAEGARSLLSTIAGSIITVASLVFSLTLVALTLAAGSIGARLLQRYMHKRTIQLTLGVFVATFVFALIVQSAIGGGDLAGVPQLSVFLAVLLALASLFWLIFAFHDLAGSIQVDNAVASLSADLQAALKRHAVEDSHAEPPLAPGERPVRFTLAAGSDGYVQFVDYSALVELAAEANALVRVRWAAGEFVLAEAELLEIEAAARPEAVECLRRDALKAFALGPQRTEESDITFRIHLMVEIAARALSPGVNDFYTALICIDHLGSALATTLRSDLQSGRYVDREGFLRVIGQPLTFATLAESALDPVRQSANGLPPVLLRLITLCGRLAGLARRPAELAVLRRHVQALRADVQDATPNTQDRSQLGTAAAEALRTIDAAEAAMAQGGAPQSPS